jgi:hypothetical protein
MNYIYKIFEQKDEIEEIDENKIKIVWSISDLKKESPGIFSMWFNKKQTREERIESFKRTKEWILKNHLEILI